jgi:hypothetical protein
MMTLLLVVLVLLLPLLALDYAALRWGVDTTDSSEHAMSGQQQYRYGHGD